ncbi:MAG: MFS transporter [Pseudomonadales bacterium]|jgi:MFS family permease|nr:MFS transporter [Pseudomonadales bacterium]MDP6470173.1 MFS transporter [Pseudomonadales bacterium]MDP6827079.1 MFS transporter [Pseudomonadales bacterium]MDP6972763.1 MFS transporter [Pseudomonadales bacterium]|tara:strand:- start:1265 stop:2596 length:1332 start_codon:yes stop_codon:yes gene_type:complete
MSSNHGTRGQAPRFTPRYRNYALGVLFLGYVVNFIDRSILSILLEPIKLELELNDTQLGLLGGLAFAIFYTTLGIPIAALADRWSRVKILSIAMIVWSGMTALCGLAQNFVMLLVTRIGVGVGEAGASPPSHSLISDYFPMETRATALSIYALGIPFGSMVGNFVGGWGAAELGWRSTFVLVGLPGILVALLIWLTLREPPRGMADTHVSTSEDTSAPGVKEVLSLLWQRVSFRHLSFAAGLHAFVGYGAGTWNAPFLIRSHDMPITEVGSWLALISGIGAIGTFLGGYLADKLSDRSDDRRWYMWVPGYSTLIMVPFQFVAYLYGGIWAVIPSLMAVSILGGMYLGPSFAMTQGLVTLRMRAVASAILLFMLNIIGMGMGPYVVGITSDLLAPPYATDSLRYALCFAVLVNLWAAIHYFTGARSLRGDLETTEAIIAQSESA